MTSAPEAGVRRGAEGMSGIYFQGLQRQTWDKAGWEECAGRCWYLVKVGKGAWEPHFTVLVSVSECFHDVTADAGRRSHSGGPAAGSEEAAGGRVAGGMWELFPVHHAGTPFLWSGNAFPSSWGSCDVS